MTIALLFPGQGSQTVGMGQAMAEKFPEAADVFKLADDIIGIPFSKLLWNGPEEELTATVNAQPAIVTTSLACWAVLAQYKIAPAYVAGHSVGEYAALVANGVLSMSDAIQLVRKRGECMYRSGQKRRGGMAAVLGLDLSSVESICKTVSSGSLILDIANLNAPGQVVVSGDAEIVAKAAPLFLEKGAKRVVQLEVSGAFHSGLMLDAQKEFDPELEIVSFSNAKCPLVSNVTALPIQNGLEIRNVLKRQIREAVQWEAIIKWLSAHGVTTVIEVGTGKVLSGLVRKIDRGIHTLQVGDPVSLQETLKAIGNSCQAVI